MEKSVDEDLADTFKGTTKVVLNRLRETLGFVDGDGNELTDLSASQLLDVMLRCPALETYVAVANLGLVGRKKSWKSCDERVEEELMLCLCSYFTCMVDNISLSALCSNRNWYQFEGLPA